MSLNFPIFLNFVRNLDEILTDLNGVCEIVHDETLQFETAFKQGIDLFSQVGRVDVRGEDGAVYRLSTGSFHGFSTRDSKELPALQAADILASSVYRVAKRVAQGKDLGPKERTLAALSLGHLAPMAICGDISTIPGIGSEDEIMRLHKVALDAAREHFAQRE